MSVVLLWTAAGLLVVPTMSSVTLSPDEPLSAAAERLARLVLGVV